MPTTNVTLQINLSPGDLRYVRWTLPHQLATLAGQVAEILLTVDTRQNHAFRSATKNYAQNLTELLSLLKRLCVDYPHASIVEVDYSITTIAEVGRAFLASKFVPLNAFDGSAFYAYLFGFLRARFDYVFHLDSDMLLGGASQQWTEEAVELLSSHTDILACYPFPGPPKPDYSATTRRLTSVWTDVTFKHNCVPSNLQIGAYSYNELTTRAFMFNRRRFLDGELSIPLIKPRSQKRLKSILLNTPPYLLLEDCITILLNITGLRCVAFLGSNQGLWSLHPRWRSESLYDHFAELIEKVETNTIPDEQRGDFDMNDSLVDWSEVYRRAKPWHRLNKNARLVAAGLVQRLQRNQ